MPSLTKNKLLNNLEPAIFWIIWLIVFTSPMIAQNEFDRIRWEPIFNSWIKLLPLLCISAINHFILVPMLFFKQKKTIYFVSVAVLVIGLLVTNNLVYFKNDFIGKNYPNRTFDQRPPKGMNPDFMPPKNFDSPRERGRNQNNNTRFYKKFHSPGALPPQLNFVFVTLLILGFDLGLRTIFKWSQSEQERTKLEKEHVNTQLAFLRNQVSPHFFMNTLNNIHSLIDIDTDEAKDAVIRLSKLMRHLLYDSEAEAIALQKELDFIHNFIDLMRLRFTDKVNIELKIQNPMPDCKIPPLLFTSFLENAFKHGVSYQEASFIHVAIASSNNTLHFSIKNSNTKAKEYSEASGIGIANAIKRLNLLYPNNYQLEVIDNSDVYTVNLTLPL